jgi:hypothetical protein
MRDRLNVKRRTRVLDMIDQTLKLDFLRPDESVFSNRTFQNKFVVHPVVSMLQLTATIRIDHEKTAETLLFSA